jgi:hypothetical protein
MGRIMGKKIIAVAIVLTAVLLASGVASILLLYHSTDNSAGGSDAAFTPYRHN